MSSITDILAPSDAERKFHRLKMLGDAITRAREAFEEKPTEQHAMQLQDAHKQYKKMRGLMPLRIVQ